MVFSGVVNTTFNFVVFSKTSPKPWEVLVYVEKFLYTCILFLGFFPGSFDGFWFNARNMFLKAECMLYSSSPQNVIVAFVCKCVKLDLKLLPFPMAKKPSLLMLVLR